MGSMPPTARKGPNQSAATFGGVSNRARAPGESVQGTLTLLRAMSMSAA